MRGELAHVLERGLAASRGAQAAPILAEWDRWVEVVEATAAAPALQLHCSDPDDQMFIDLAQTQRVQWLLTRDRALLRLARRARAHGVEVLTPEGWTARQPA
jgi:predicted nucleic acid-binding protein